MNLYELRRIDPAECDGVLLGNGAEQEEGIKPGYRYDYPVELLLLIRNERDFDRVYNTLLVEAYQYRQQLPCLLPMKRMCNLHPMRIVLKNSIKFYFSCS